MAVCRGAARRVGLLALALTGLVQAADPGAERAVLAAERARIEHRHDAEVQACRARFAVTPCIDAARQVRRQALEAVRAQELRLDDADRARRAQERRQTLEARRAARAERLAAAASEAEGPVAAPTPRTAASAPARGAVQETASLAAGSRPAAASAAADTEAARRAARLAERQQDIQARQQRISARQAARAASGVRHDTLPRP